MKPFSGLKVVELASVLAGPTVGLFFAELGAEVIKIENKTTGGDVTRNWKVEGETGKISAYYSAANWGKKSVFLNLKDSPDKLEVFKLLANADILITNFKYGDDVKFGLDYKSLKEKFPKLIVGEISGFAEQKSRVAYDVVLQAETGFMSMNGTPESGPVKMPVALMDLLAAHQLKEGLLVALLQLGKTKKGCCVSVSLEEAALASLANQASNYLMARKVAQPMGSLHPNISPYGDVFKCVNQLEILLAVGSDTQFVKLCEILNIAETATDIKFSTNANRVKNRGELQKILAPEFLRFNRDELLENLIRNQVPAAAIKTLDQVLTSATAKKMILKETIEGTQTQRLQTVAFKIKV